MHIGSAQAWVLSAEPVLQFHFCLPQTYQGATVHLLQLVCVRSPESLVNRLTVALYTLLVKGTELSGQ